MAEGLMTDGDAQPGTEEQPPGAAQQAAGGRPAEKRRSSRLRSAVSLARLVVVLAVLVVVVVVGITVAITTGPPSEGDLLKQAGMTGKHELLVGVKDDQPGVAMLDKSTGRYSGFDVDIAYMIAGDLGFRRNEVRFLTIESEDRIRMLATDSQTKKFTTVDMVIASFSITQERITNGANFSAPYLITEQSVVTRKGHAPVETLADLAKERVCTIATSTSAVALSNDRLANVRREKRIGTCINGLVKRPPIFDAVTTDAAILAGFVHDARYKGLLEHHDIGLETQEMWGVNVGPNEALKTLVNLSLYRSWHDPGNTAWEEAYEKNLLPEQADSPAQDVAEDHQPEYGRPAVREWPWQR
jgi:glutamate transport system substrate-binding protein